MTLDIPSWLHPIIELDHDIMVFLNGLHADWLDPVMLFVTWPITWIPLYVFILYRIFKKTSWKRVLLVLASVGLIVTLADQTSVKLFKNQFERPRPSHHEVIGPQMHHVVNLRGELYKGGEYGFVSSHAANYFGITTLLFFVFGGRKIKTNYLLFLWAALIGYSRIYLGVHYPADIIGGALLGALIGWMIYKSAYTYVSEKWLKASNL